MATRICTPTCAQTRTQTRAQTHAAPKEAKGTTDTFTMVAVQENADNDQNDRQDTATLVAKYRKGGQDIWVVLSVQDAEHFQCSYTGYKWFLRYVGDDDHDEDITQVLSLDENHIWYGSAWSSDEAKAREIAQELEDIERSEAGVVSVAFTQRQLDFAEDNKMRWEDCNTYVDDESNDGWDEGEARRYEISWRRVCMCVDCGMILENGPPPAAENHSNE